MTIGARLGRVNGSSSCPGGDPGETLDVVGIGFGPSNLALAIAIEEHNQAAPEREQLRSAFFEKQPRFGWHRGMLIDDATTQVSYLKDLVTRRNPTSDYSLFSYLHQVGRLDASRVVKVLDETDRVDVTVENLPSEKRTTLSCDVVVYATGYRPVDVLRSLGSASGLCSRDDEGMVCVERDYRMSMESPALAGIYLQGATEHTHGISSSLLSNIAMRTGEIVRSIVEHRRLFNSVSASPVML